MKAANRHVGSLLAEARELHSPGHVVAAAVTLRSACEAFIFQLCERIGYHGNSRRSWRTPRRIDGLHRLGLLDSSARHHCYVVLEVGGARRYRDRGARRDGNQQSAGCGERRCSLSTPSRYTLMTFFQK